MFARNPLGPLASLLAACLLIGVPSPAQAQDDAINLRELARKGRTIQGWARAPITGENKVVFDQFFDRYYFPELAKTDAASLGNLAKMRTELFERYIWPSHPSVQKELTDRVYSFAEKAALASQAPAPLRYNAVLMLGALDEKYASRNDPNAVPHSKANALLCKMVKFRDKLPTYIEVAALIGLQRHTQHFAALGNAEKSATAIVLLEAVDQQKFRPGASREVQNWIRLQAAEGIANMKIAGRDGMFVKAIAKLVGDPEADLATRSSAAVMLRQFNLEGVPPAVANETVGAVKSLACAVGSAEREAAQEFVDLQRRRGGIRSETDKSPRFRFDETGWVYERAGLVGQLEQLRVGLTAVEPLAGDDAASVKSLGATVQAAIDTANSTSNIDLDVTDGVNQMADQIESLAGCNPQPAEAADEAVDELLEGA